MKHKEYYLYIFLIALVICLGIYLFFGTWDFWGWLMTAIIVIGLIAGGFEYSHMMALEAIPRKFKELGNLKGKTLEEIERKVGRHTSHQRVKITDMNNVHGYWYSWRTPKYYVKLLFDQDRNCIGVTEEKHFKKQGISLPWTSQA